MENMAQLNTAKTMTKLTSVLLSAQHQIVSDRHCERRQLPLCRHLCKD